MMLKSRFFRRLAAVACLCSAVLLIAAVRADDGSGGSSRWYKGNTHAHSLWSDGDTFPEMAADWYKSHGYDFLALTDHDCLMAGEKWVPLDRGKHFVASSEMEKCLTRFGSNWLETRQQDGNREVKLKTYGELCAKLAEPGKFLLIQGEEISAKSGDHNVHLNAINLAEPIAPKNEQSVVETLLLNLASVKEQAERLSRPILVQVNHPNWKDYDIVPEDLAQASTARFFEVCNGGGTEIHNVGDATHPSTEKLWDIANTIRIAKMKAPPLYGIAADDTHAYQQFAPACANPGQAWIMVRAKQLSADALLDALRRGDFYASTGVLLRDVAYDANERAIFVKVQSEPGVHYTIEFVGSEKGVDPAAQPVEPNAANGQNSRRPGRKYSSEVGKVLAGVKGDSASYRLSGKELYVRAVVRSDKSIPNAPPGDIRKQEAWCQPVGWQP